MRNNFHYGFGARLTAVILTLLMVLSVSGLTLRSEGADGPTIFEESSGTFVPEDAPETLPSAPEATEVPAESTDAPEATEPPAADTPAPEMTEAPIEATPVPETDSGTDTNVNTSEPEITADPQMTPVPEGDMPADEVQMDEPAPAEASDHTLKVTLTKDAEKNQYTLTIENTGAAYTDFNNLQVQFESKDVTTNSNCEVEAVSATIDGKTIDAISGKQTIDITEDFRTIEIKLVIKENPSDGKPPAFRVKLHNGFLGDNANLLYTDSNGVVTVSSYAKKGGYPTGLTKGNSDTPGTPSGGGDDGEHCDVHITYHLNDDSGNDIIYIQDPDGWKPGSGPDESGNYTFTLLNIDDITWKEGTENGEKINIPIDGKLSKEKADGGEYFAGWMEAEGDFAWGTSTYKNITYPFARNQIYNKKDGVVDIDARLKGYADNEHYRHLELAWDGSQPTGMQTVTKSESIDLYAIWAPTKYSGLVGYTMTISSGDWDGGKQSDMAYNGQTQTTRAKKYVVLDQGHQKGEPITLRSDTPGNSGGDGYSFIAWYNKGYKPKSAKDSGTYLDIETDGVTNADNALNFPGGQLYYGNTNLVFSMDAMWGRIKGEAETALYDGAPHDPSAGLDVQGVGEDGDVLAALTAEYGVNNNKTGNNGVTYDVAVTGAENSTKSNNALSSFVEHPGTGVVGVTLPLPQYREAGKYNYHVIVKFSDVTASTGKSSSLPISTTGTEVTGDTTLTIYPRLTLNVTKKVAGQDTPTDDEFTFTVTGDEGTVVGKDGTIEKFTSTELTAKADGTAKTEVWFSTDGDHTLTVTEKAGTVSGMTYDTEKHEIHVTVANSQITSVQVDKADAAAPENKSDATANLTVTNSMQATVIYHFNYGAGDVKYLDTTPTDDAGDQAIFDLKQLYEAFKENGPDIDKLVKSYNLNVGHLTPPGGGEGSEIYFCGWATKETVENHAEIEYHVTQFLTIAKV